MAITTTMKMTWCIVLLNSHVAAYDNMFATKHQHFLTTLDKQTFFKNQNNVEFTVSLDEMPDLPTWLKFHQKDPASEAILYGTPDDKAFTVGLAIVAWNKDTYETAHRVVMLSVLDRAPNITQGVEIKLNNDAVDVVSNPQPLLQLVNKIWDGVHHIGYVEKASQRGVKSDRGVFVGICGDALYPDSVKELLEEAESKKCRASDGRNEIKTMFANAGYNVDWCAITDRMKNPKPKNERRFEFDKNSRFFDADLKTTKWDDTTEDLSMDIVYVFAAVFVGLLLIAFVTSIMFCHREGLQDITPKEQLMHHKALRRVGAEIRNMSNGKDDERNGIPYGKLDEDTKYGTLSGKNKGTDGSETSPSPPPYRHDNGKNHQVSQF